MTISVARQVRFWLLTVVVIAAALWLLHGILLPFVAGTALAYLLDPIANRLERLGLNRLAAALLIVGIFVLALLIMAILIVPLIAAQFAAFIDKLPGYVTQLQSLVTDPNRPWVRKIVGESFADATKSTGELVRQSMGWLATFLRSLWSGGQAVISFFSLAVVTPVVAFYLICDWKRIIATLDEWIPRPQLAVVRALAREIDTAIAGFVRGQTGVCLILGSYYAVALTVAGLNFGLLIGLISGLLSFIPYVGSLTGLLLGAGVAVVQFAPDYASIIVVVAIFLIGQFVEGYILAPKLVGEKVGLHPVWLMFALFAFGYLFGFVGLLVAVPLAAAVGVLTRFALRQYLASPVYTGAPADSAGADAIPGPGPELGRS
ncbi:MAG TPA: AI-2E family transporter [Xanthobacteraceae bacterium]|jgi:predicted PurR-regulated permease PerM|nr:AI-2E family transporter [Xanthobacteraceae bacterium]